MSRLKIARTNDPTVLILTSLAGGPKHGYLLASDIAEFSGVELRPGTLYGAITRLEEQGLIAPTGSDAEDDRRRTYGITSEGRQLLEVAIRSMREVAEVGAARLGFSLSTTGLRWSAS
jgi:DNA-binding PadR family transcriptional regulator